MNASEEPEQKVCFDFGVDGPWMCLRHYVDSFRPRISCPLTKGINKKTPLFAMARCPKAELQFPRSFLPVLQLFMVFLVSLVIFGLFDFHQVKSEGFDSRHRRRVVADFAAGVAATGKADPVVLRICIP